MNGGFRLVDRDYLIMREIDRWRVITGKQICCIARFSGTRACDRRLHKLINAGLIEREKILYGTPNIYKLTSKGKALTGVSQRKGHVRIEHIAHDIAVTNTAIYFNIKYEIPFSSMTTEKQLHSIDGFGKRVHRPDFIFNLKNRVCCVEVELTLKSSAKFEKNIIENFNTYDRQIWIVPDLKNKIYSFLHEMNKSYPNIKIIELSEVINEVEHYKFNGNS